MELVTTLKNEQPSPPLSFRLSEAHEEILCYCSNRSLDALGSVEKTAKIMLSYL